MKLPKMIYVLVIMVTMAFPTYAIDVSPEIDTVGCDSTHFFLDRTGRSIIVNNVSPSGIAINNYSNFPYDDIKDRGEYFISTGVPRPDPCFSTRLRRYNSILTDAFNSGEYEWSIVLQMEPETDINLKITDCVLRHNEFDPFSDATQTGLYRDDSGNIVFEEFRNPTLIVTAHPGPNSSFVDPFHLEARRLPDLSVVALDGIEYTSKGIFEETIVIKRPLEEVNSIGEKTYPLKQGDQIRIQIVSSIDSPIDIRYGKDNVRLEYIGIRGTEYYTGGRPCRWDRFLFPRPIEP